jgi:hypothetical protein
MGELTRSHLINSRHQTQHPRRHLGREAWIVPILNSIAQNRVRFSLGCSGSIQLNCCPFPLVSAPARESS